MGQAMTRVRDVERILDGVDGEDLRQSGAQERLSAIR